MEYWLKAEIEVLSTLQAAAARMISPVISARKEPAETTPSRVKDGEIAGAEAALNAPKSRRSEVSRPRIRKRRRARLSPRRGKVSEKADCPQERNRLEIGFVRAMPRSSYSRRTRHCDPDRSPGGSKPWLVRRLVDAGLPHPLCGFAMTIVRNSSWPFELEVEVRGRRGEVPSAQAFDMPVDRRVMCAVRSMPAR